MSKGSNLEERLIKFAVAIIGVCEDLPNTPTAKHIRGQLLRSGTSAAPNYAEARAAESGRDFVHKLSVALKEMNETSVWLRIILRAKLVEQDRCAGCLDESQQLGRILSRSIHTAKGTARSRGE